MAQTGTPSSTLTESELLGRTGDASLHAVASQGHPAGVLALQDSHDASILQEADNAPQRGTLRLAAIIFSLMLALFTAALDTTIVATVLPTISSDLESAAGYVWIGGAFLLGNAAASNIWANLSDIWGRKPILLTATGVFFVSSIICAKAVNMAMLIAGRAIQGTAAGGLMQLVNICVSDLFSVRRRSLFLGLLEIVWIVAAAVGPVLGGGLTEALNWRWIFWINLPISGVAFITLFLFLNLHDPKTPVAAGVKAIDWFGSVTIVGLSVMLLMGLNFGGVVFAWDSQQVICLLVFGLFMVPIFIYGEKHFAKIPLMPLAMFKRASNAAAFLVTFCHGAVVIGMEWYLPLYFQSTRLASPLQSGVWSLPLIVTESIMSFFVGFIIHKTGRYLDIIWIGCLLVLLGTGLYINFDTDTSAAKIIGFQIVAGLGTGQLFFAPLLALQTGVSADETAAATATFGFIRNLATSASIVLGGVLFQNSMNSQQGKLIASGLPQNVTSALDGENAAANVLLVGDIENLHQRRVVQDAFAASLKQIWYLYTALAALGVLSCFFIKKNVMSKDHVETKTGLKEGRMKEKDASGVPPGGHDVEMR